MAHRQQLLALLNLPFTPNGEGLPAINLPVNPDNSPIGALPFNPVLENTLAEIDLGSIEVQDGDSRALHPAAKDEGEPAAVGII
jgi:hypothetical protein